MDADLVSIKKKIVLIGDGAVGKTSLVRRFVLDQFSDEYLVTMGVKVSKKDLIIENVKLSLMLWDVMGQTEFTMVQAQAMEDARGAIIVCDITRRETLDSVIDVWLGRLNKATGPVPMVFLANKADLEGQAAFGLGELEKLTEGLEAPCMLTSAKTGMNVQKTFATLGIMLMAKQVQAGHTLEGVLPEELKTPADAAFLINEDFCMKHGEVAVAMQILKNKYLETGTDPLSPEPAGLERIVRLLHTVEVDLQGKDAADINLANRLKVLGWVAEGAPPRAKLVRGPRAAGKYPKAQRA